jgi:hypothetical protein
VGSAFYGSGKFGIFFGLEEKSSKKLIKAQSLKAFNAILYKSFL